MRPFAEEIAKAMAEVMEDATRFGLQLDRWRGRLRPKKMGARSDTYECTWRLSGPPGRLTFTCRKGSDGALEFTWMTCEKDHQYHR